MKLKTITDAIESFAPLSLQESYDNCGLQIGDPQGDVSAALLCLDVTEDVMDEAVERGCDLVISHHPLLFRGLKHITGTTPAERIATRAIRDGISIYSAHTNLDSATHGVSDQMARMLSLRSRRPLCPTTPGADTGLGIIGEIEPTPVLEYLRHVKDTFAVRALRYTEQSPHIVIRRVALCGGAGAEFIGYAIAAGADLYITGDVKYHDFAEHASQILIADIGHWESEACAPAIFARILRESCPDFPTYAARADRNPIGVL